MINVFLIKQALKYYLGSKHAKGYGIHSPFVFEFVRGLLCSKSSYYHFETVKNVRKSYLACNDILELEEYGAGSKHQVHHRKTVRNIAANSSITPKYGEVLFKIVTRFKPSTIVELGTSLGISTLYLALPDKRNKVYTIEGRKQCVKLAQGSFSKLELDNVQVINGSFEEQIPVLLNNIPEVDLLFIDGDHRKEATLNYFKLFLEKANNGSVFIFDDIHWSEEMYDAWKEIISHPLVTVSIDLFRMGIVFFRKECQKQHFVVRY